MFILSLSICFAYCGNHNDPPHPNTNYFSKDSLLKEDIDGFLLFHTNICEIEQFLFACQFSGQDERTVFLRDAIDVLWTFIENFKYTIAYLFDLSKEPEFRNYGNCEIEQIVAHNKKIMEEAGRLLEAAEREVGLLGDELEFPRYFENLRKCEALLDENVENYNLWVHFLVEEYQVVLEGIDPGTKKVGLLKMGGSCSAGGN